MATAVETPSQPRTPNPPANLVVASLVGAVYVVAALAVVLYVVPRFWGQYVTPQMGGNNLMDWALRLAAQVAVAVGLGWFGRSLAGSNPPRGLRGGIFLVILAAAVVFLVTQSVGLWIEGTPLAGTTGMVITGVVGLVLLFGAFRLVTSPRGERWMVALEEQGWFHAAGYKRALGQKVRRLTILGILLVGATGVYSLMFQQVLPENWTITLPFTEGPDGGHQRFTLLTEARYAIPLALLGLTIWVAYRVVNMPTFAEFLIATEAEMNKVSWSSRRRLTQDTIVVLVTTLLMALFLFAVDMFWGWLLSTKTVGVLPERSTNRDKGGQVQGAKW